MTNRTTRNRQRRIWMAAIFSLSLLTCFGLPSSAGFLGATYARQSAPPLTQQEIVKQLVELAATKEAFTFTPATAQQKLGKLAKLELVKDPSNSDLQRLLGANPDSGIQWIEVVFERSKASWKFREATFAFAPGDGGLDKLYNDFKPVLGAKLGKQTEETPTYGVIWDLKPRYSVQLMKENSAVNPITEKTQQTVMIHLAIDPV
jgi:hypothetical protein